jgi:hypothetical protein
MKIAHAAIREKNPPHRIFTGKHHAECFAKYHTIDPHIEAGFMTDTGEFVDRQKALLIAVEAGQIECPALISEELWSKQNNGKHDYNPETGYILKTGE